MMELKCACGGALLDTQDKNDPSKPGRGPRLANASYPATVWAACEACGKRETVLASQRDRLKRPWEQ